MAKLREKIIRHARVDRATINQLIYMAYSNYKEHGRESIPSAITEATADLMIARYEEKIRNGFRRAGVELPEDGLSLDAILGVIQERTGLTIENLTPEGVMRAVDRELALRLSGALGFQVETVLNRDQLMASIQGYVIEQIRSGRAGEWIGRTTLRTARRYITYKNRGISQDNAQRMRWRQASRRYRKTHRLIWV